MTLVVLGAAAAGSAFSLAVPGRLSEGAAVAEYSHPPYQLSAVPGLPPRDGSRR